MLGVFTHKKPREWYVHQYYNAPRYKDREKAITYGTRLQAPEGKQLILDALEDDFWYIRQLAISKLDKLGADKKPAVFEYLKTMATSDENSQVRSAAINALSSDFFKAEFEGKTRVILIETIEKTVHI